MMKDAKEATVLKEIINIYPLQVCYACMRTRSVSERKADREKDRKDDINGYIYLDMPFSDIHLTKQLTIWISSCIYWNNRKKGENKRNPEQGWGPVPECPYSFEHSLCKKKFRVTNIKDLDIVKQGIQKGECFIVQSEAEYIISVISGTVLDKLDVEQLKTIYGKMRIYSPSAMVWDNKRTLIELIKSISWDRLNSLDKLVKAKNPFTPRQAKSWLTKKGLI